MVTSRRRRDGRYLPLLEESLAMFATSRRTAVVAVVIAALAACGCSGPSTTGPSALPTETSTMVVFSQNLDDVEAGGQRVVNFTVPRRGTLAITVRWNDPANSVVAVLTGTNCRSLRNSDGDCSVRRSVEREARPGARAVHRLSRRRRCL